MKSLPWKQESGRRKKRRILHNQELHKKPVIPDRFRLILGIAAGLAILALLVLLVRPQAQLLNSPEAALLQRRGILRVGVTENVPGLGMEGGGLEVDLARSLTAILLPEEDVNSALLLVPVTRNTAIPKLNADEVDLLLCQRPYTSSESYVCSAPYYSDPLRLLCRAEQSRETPEGAKIAVLQNSPVINQLSSHFSGAELPPELMPYAGYPDMLEALSRGVVEYIALPQSVASRYLEGYTLHPEQVGSLSYVAVGSADAPAVIQLFDRMLAEYQKDGSLQALLQANGLQAQTQP